MPSATERASPPAARRTTSAEHPTGRGPVRVCFLIDQLERGGTETQLLALIRGLDRSRVRPYLCLLRGVGGPRALRPSGCPVLSLGVSSLKHPSTLGAALRLARFLRRERIDVLQTYFPDSTCVGMVVGWLAGVPCRVRTRNNMGHASTRAERWLGRLLGPITSLRIANCNAARLSLLREEGAAPASVIVLENGVDMERFSAIDPPGERQPERSRIGAVANLRPVKGLDVLVEAAASLGACFPGAEVCVAGEGDQRGPLEEQVRRHGLTGRFHLPGAITDVPAFLAGLDVAVLCSRAEGMPNAVLEYMAAGRPVVATAVGAVPEMIEDGVHGLLVPPGSPARLAEAIARLLRDRPLARRLGAAARQRIRERYARPVMIERFQRLYERLASQV